MRERVIESWCKCRSKRYAVRTCGLVCGGQRHPRKMHRRAVLPGSDAILRRAVAERASNRAYQHTQDLLFTRQWKTSSKPNPRDESDKECRRKIMAKMESSIAAAAEAENGRRQTTGVPLVVTLL